MSSVHGGLHKEGLVITKDHTEGLDEMDKLSDFAPLHVSYDVRFVGGFQLISQNHHAVLAVKACLEALPNHTSLLLFDTLFHVSSLLTASSVTM
jgi:acetate kinase